jgi:hypothetical protein
MAAWQFTSKFTRRPYPRTMVGDIAHTGHSDAASGIHRRQPYRFLHASNTEFYRSSRMTEITYQGLTLVTVAEQAHLGGNVKEGDPYSFCPRVWNYIIERFCISSMMDLGSGIGNAAHFFFTKNIKTVAIDGLAQNMSNASYPTICHDLTRGPVITKVDLVHCQEVVEHIEERYLDNLLTSLTCGRVILLSHALPGADSHHHVNNQPMEYWVKHISGRGYNLLMEDTNRIREMAAQDRAIYIQNTGLLFHRN